MVNFPEHANNELQVLPDGTYTVQLLRWEKKVAGTGTEQIRWYAKVLQGSCDGCSLIDHLALTENAEWRVAKFVKAALNFEKGDLSALGNIPHGSEKFTRLMDACKERKMLWSIETDAKYGNNKVKDYVPYPDQAKFTDELENVPDFVKVKEVFPGAEEK